MTDIIQAEQISQPDIIRSYSKHLRSRKTPRHKINIKPGTTFKYVKQKWFYNWLDEHYPGWSWELDTSFKDDKGGFITVIGKLIVLDPNTNLIRQVSSVGTKQAIVSKEKGLIEHPYYKSAETDAVKRAAIKLGAFNDIYGEYEADADETVPEVEIGWYIENIVPLMLSKGYEGTKIYKQLNSFLMGTITFKDIQELKIRLES